MIYQKKWSALWFALLFYWLLVSILIFASITNIGHFGYPIDDTYIHMAMAKHLAKDGFWGVSEFGFSSSTSSPLWTFLIAVSYVAFGVNDYLPFLLALITGTSIIIYCHAILSKLLNSSRLKIILVSIIIFMPLSILSVLGMEHLLHALLTLSLLIKAVEFLENQQFNWKKMMWLAILSAATVLTRYEGLFLVFSICLLLLAKRRFVSSILIGSAGLFPVFAYGFFSISKGWLFLPNSLLIKGNTQDGLYSFFGWLFNNISLAPHIFILIIINIGLYSWAQRRHLASKKDKYLVILFVMMGYFHMQFASVGWFFRYDAYLILIGILIITHIIGPHLDVINLKFHGRVIKSTACLLFGILLGLPLIIRTEAAHAIYSTATKNIYEQQYQMGLFLNRYYTGAAIAANDIGAINYIADIKTLDLYGLSSIEVIKAKRNNEYDTAKVRKLTLENKVEIIIIYDILFKENLPPEWIEVGKWKISNNVVCSDDVITFYVMEEAYMPKAINSLQGFSGSLPADVEQLGVYTNH